MIPYRTKRILGLVGLIAMMAWLPTVGHADEPFLISYWWGPEPSDASMARIAAANFTVAAGPGGRKALDLAHKHGLKMILQDPRITANGPGDRGFAANLDAVTADYRNHPALWGYFITDEPNASQFESLAAIHRRLVANDPKSTPFINLFPTYASPQQLGNPTYDAHVAAFLRIVRPRLLSYDHYALLNDGIRPDYFENLEIVRRRALEANIPFCYVLLSVAHFSYRNPNEAELRWQANTALAYGAQGIVYFTYVTPPPTKDYEGWRDAIESFDGKPLAKYEQVKRINGELKRIGPILNRLTSTAVYHSTPVPRGARAIASGDLVAAIEGGQFVVGEFRDPQKRRYLMFVNRDERKPAEPTIRFRGNVRLEQLDPPSGPVTDAQANADGAAWKVRFDPGQRRLVRID